jgi:hypothetical protein
MIVTLIVIMLHEQNVKVDLSITHHFQACNKECLGVHRVERLVFPSLVAHMLSLHSQSARFRRCRQGLQPYTLYDPIGYLNDGQNPMYYSFFPTRTV